jgi:2'-5' RNA ligase
MSPLPERMTDHWWWRPGVTPGRRLYVWHILFGDEPAVQDLAAGCQDRLDGISGLDLVPMQWLHMTTQIVGFADEISDAELVAMIEVTGRQLRSFEPVSVRIGRPLFHSEAVMMGVEPRGALDPVRNVIREAVAATVRVNQLADAPEWTPHVSIAYSNLEASAGPVIEAMRPSPPPSKIDVRRVHLVSQERVGRSYVWKDLATAKLGMGS